MEENKESENIAKITITKKAADRLAELLEKVNTGFGAGRITRQDLASFVLEKSTQNFSDRDMATLRNLHYDEAYVLESAYRTMRETGEVPDFLRDALRKQFQSTDEPRKSSKKSLNKEYINDVLEENEEAV